LNKIAVFADNFSRINAALGLACVFALLCLISVDVFLRYLFSSPLLFSNEVAGYLVALTGFFGTAETMRRNQHVRVEIIVNAMSTKVRLWCDLAAYFLGLVTLVVFAWHVLVFIDRAFERGTVSPSILAVPLWIPQSAMLIGTTALILQLTVDSGRIWAGIRKTAAAGE
jgi:C4-dicarboxylate transporter, DctQ subunit